jgi:DNA-binding beta-propeller fold protein YncE
MNRAHHVSAVACLLICACADDTAASHCTLAHGTICTIAGTGVAGLSGDQGQAIHADLYLPMDMTPGPDGKLYFLDWNNHRVRAIDAQGTIRTVAGDGLLGDGPEGPALSAHFNHPTNITFDSAGHMIIAAWHNSRVVRVDLESGILDDIAGTGMRAYMGDGEPARSAVLDLPASVACDAEDNLYIMDQANQTVRRIDGNGIIDRFAGQCLIGSCDEGEQPQQCPGTDKWSCLSDTDPDACKKPCDAAFGGDGGPARQARFAQGVGQSADPAGRITFGPDGSLYVADSGNNRVRKIDLDGIITTVAGNGMADHAGDDGPATEASLDNPVDVAVAADGTLFIADTYNSCIRRVTPAGTIQTFAGKCGQRGFAGDGELATRALLDRPYGIALDLHGNLYVADTHNHRLRLISQ